MVHVDINSGQTVICAADAPCNETYNLPASGNRLTHERGPAIAVTSVFALFATRADLSRGQAEAGARGRVGFAQPLTEQVVAPVPIEKRNINLVLDKLKLSMFAVLTPPGDPAPDARLVAELEVEHVVAAGVAGRVHAVPAELDGGPGVGEEHGDVVGKTVRIVSRMSVDSLHLDLLMFVAFGWVDAARVVFSDTNFKAAAI